MMNLSRLTPALALIASLLPSSLAAASAESPPPSAVYGRWQASRIGSGGYHQGVLLCPTEPHRVYTYVDTAGIFRSDDDGETWRQITAGMRPRSVNYQVRSLAVDPRNADVLLAAFSAGSGLYRSTDGGTSWTNVLPDVPFHGNNVDRQGGPLIVFHPRNPDIVLAATQGGGAFKSIDNGRTWRRTGLEGHYATNLVIDQAEPNRAWLSANPRALRKDGIPADAMAVPKSAQAPSPADVTRHRGGFYVTEDAGETWHLLFEHAPKKIVQDPVAPETLYGIFGEYGIIRVSHDRGITWSELSDGLLLDRATLDTWVGSYSDHKYLALAAGPGFVVCSSGKGTFYRLERGQSTWKKIDLEGVRYPGHVWSRSKEPAGSAPDPFGRRNHFASAVSSILIDPANPDRWFFTDWYAVYQTFDGGRNWKLTVEGIESTAVLCVRQDPNDPARVYLGMSDNGYFQSRDGGRSFAKPAANAGWDTSNMKWISPATSQPGLVLMIGSGSQGKWISNQIYRSEDQGRSWSRAPMTGLPDTATYRFGVIGVHPAKAAEAYVGVSGDAQPGQGGLYRSTDGGLAWTWFGAGLSGTVFSSDFWTEENQLAVHPAGQMLLVGSGDKKPWRFSDGRWTRLTLDISARVNLAVDRHRPGVFYLTEHGKGVFRSSDAGLTWRLVKPYAGKLFCVETDHSRPGRVAVTLDETVLYSDDDGATWTDLDPERKLPCLPGRSLAFAGNRLVMATRACGAFWTTLE